VAQTVGCNDEADARLIAAAPWYKVLAKIATDAGTNCGILEIWG